VCFGIRLLNEHSYNLLFQVPLRRKTETSFAESSLVFCSHPWCHTPSWGVISLYWTRVLKHTSTSKVCHKSHTSTRYTATLILPRTLIAAFWICMHTLRKNPLHTYAHGVRHDQLSGMSRRVIKRIERRHKVLTPHTHILFSKRAHTHRAKTLQKNPSKL
jgi:hypothetical protein